MAAAAGAEDGMESGPDPAVVLYMADGHSLVDSAY